MINLQYQGGKSRISKQISEVITNALSRWQIKDSNLDCVSNRERESNQTFVSLFCGSCSVESKVKGYDRIICNDKHEYLIEMLKGVQNGYELPELITEEQYKYIKDHKDEDKILTGFVGFGCSFGGKFFGGYATAQLRRLENKSNRLVGQEQLEEYIHGTLLHVADSFEEKYGIPAGQINLYIDKAVNPDMSTEIFMDANLTHYPIRDYTEMWAELKNVIKSYKNIGARNNKAIEHDKLGKHMMHLIRLYMMCLDILENEKIVTYREAEHDLLMDIRNGKYLDTEKQPTPEFYEMVNDYEKRVQYAKENTSLPDKPDYNKINEFVASVNERVVKGEF